MGKRWTSQDVAALKNMAQKYPANVIAEKLDRTVGGVVFKAHRVPLKSRQTSEAIGDHPGRLASIGLNWIEGMRNDARSGV
jgi:hypothetical protein